MEEVRLGIRNLKTGQIVAISSPLPMSHWPFSMPPADTVLWRYGDYWKFKQLFVEKQLYFRRADKLGDQKEGRFTDGNQTARSALFGQAFSELSLGDPAKIHEIQESHRCRAFLQCWHENAEESPRMWHEYTSSPDSVVIASTVGILGASIRHHCQAFSVNYVDEGFPLPELHSVAPFAYKRRQFDYEKEFRLLHMLPPEESIYLDQPADFSRLIQGDPVSFVHELRFHPKASAEFKRLVRADLTALGLRFPMNDSRCR